MKNRLYHLAGIIIFSSYLFALISSLPSAGIFWDEPAYYQSSLNYLSWFKNPSLKTIDRYFLKYNDTQFELHPPVEKISQAVSYEIFHNRLRLLNEIDAFKLPNLLFASLFVAAVYFFSLRYFGFTTALAASLFLALTPRFFGHARFAAMDIPVTLFVFLSAWSFWHFRHKTLLIPGLLLGLALSSKMSGYLFIIPFSIFYLLYHAKHLIGKRMFSIFSNLLLMASLPLVVLFLLFPKFWLDPVPRFLEFFTFFSGNKVPFMYFGKTNVTQPWHFPWVMLGITTPVLTLFFGFIGIILPLLLKINKKKATHFLPPTSRFLPQTFYPKPLASNLSPLTSHFPPLNSYFLPLTSYLLVNLLFLPVLFSLPGVAAYDAERLLLPSFPFLAIFAGIGLNFTISYLINSKILDFKFRFYILHFALYVIAILPSFIMLHHYYPYETSAYNSLIGEIKGASGAGMEPQYTLEAYKGTLDYINKNCPRNCLIYAHSNVSPYAWYQKDGLLRKDILLTDNPGDLSASYFYVLPVRKSLFYGPAAPIYENADPSFRVAIDGISLVNLYKTSTLTRYISP